jgi:predicted nucleic acid-binding protein
MRDDRAFLDTNVLLYAFNRGDRRRPRAELLIDPSAVIGVQVLNEFVAVARRKMGMTWKETLEALEAIKLVFPHPEPLTFAVHAAAVEIAAARGYHIYDSLIIASAQEAGCNVLYSEDLHHGQAIGGLTICNPFR